MNHFRYYEPGLIIGVPNESDGLYHVDFGRFSLHLNADEFAADDGNGVDPRARPGWLQNLFCELLIDGVAYAEDGQPVNERWLTGKFYNFGNNLPAKVCAKAGFEAGTTYAQAARRLRHDSDRV